MKLPDLVQLELGCLIFLSISSSLIWGFLSYSFCVSTEKVSVHVKIHGRNGLHPLQSYHRKVWSLKPYFVLEIIARPRLHLILVKHIAQGFNKEYLIYKGKLLHRSNCDIMVASCGLIKVILAVNWYCLQKSTIRVNILD